MWRCTGGRAARNSLDGTLRQLERLRLACAAGKVSLPRGAKIQSRVEKRRLGKSSPKKEGSQKGADEKAIGRSDRTATDYGEAGGPMQGEQTQGCTETGQREATRGTVYCCTGWVKGCELMQICRGTGSCPWYIGTADSWMTSDCDIFGPRCAHLSGAQK